MVIIEYITKNEGMDSESSLTSRHFRLGIRSQEKSEYIRKKKE